MLLTASMFRNKLFNATMTTLNHAKYCSKLNTDNLNSTLLFWSIFFLETPDLHLHWEMKVRPLCLSALCKHGAACIGNLQCVGFFFFFWEEFAVRRCLWFSCSCICIDASGTFFFFCVCVCVAAFMRRRSGLEEMAPARAGPSPGGRTRPAGHRHTNERWRAGGVLATTESHGPSWSMPAAFAPRPRCLSTHAWTLGSRQKQDPSYSSGAHDQSKIYHQVHPPNNLCLQCVVAVIEIELVDRSTVYWMASY